MTVLVSMAFVFAASANFPPLLLALTWRRFNTAGALTGIAFGIIASVVMIVLSPPVWPGPDSPGLAVVADVPGPRDDPDRLPRLLARARCSAARSEDARTYDELLVRSETGLGSEGADPRRPRGASRRRPRAATADEALQAARIRAGGALPPYAAGISWLPRKISSGSTSALIARRRA